MDNFEQVGQSVLSKVEPLTSQPFYKETMSKLNDLDDMAIKLSHKPHLKDELCRVRRIFLPDRCELFSRFYMLFL